MIRVAVILHSHYQYYMNKFTLLLSAVLAPTIVLAEGSKDLFKKGQTGYRA